jgi:hypothetical protein
MAQRTTTVVLGDWSGDGHGISEKYNVILRSEYEHVLEDVVLAENYQNTADLLGFHLGDIMAEYQESTISTERWTKILSAGFEDLCPSDGAPNFYDNDGEEHSFLELAIWFVLRSLPIQWQTEEVHPVLLGRSDAIIQSDEASSVGYGLFSS